jgi:hypothetical protein
VSFCSELIGTLHNYSLIFMITSGYGWNSLKESRLHYLVAEIVARIIPILIVSF